MNKREKLSFLRDNYFDEYMKTRQQSYIDLSDQQTMFCCCGKLATGLHERSCSLFNRKVDAETILRLRHLLPNKSAKNFASCGEISNLASENYLLYYHEHFDYIT